MFGADKTWLARKPARDTNGKLALEQLRLAMRNLAPIHWVMPIFAAIICVIFAQWIAVPVLACWFSAVLVSAIPLAIVTRMFSRREHTAVEAEKWIVLTAASCFVFAVTWATMGIVLWVPGSDLNHLVILLILACTIAGNMAVVGASTPLTAVCMGVYGIAIILTPLRQGGLVYNGISLMAAVFTGYLIYTARQIYLTVRNMLLLREDKNDLIVALAKSKSESDEARERAEAASRAKSEFLANMSHELRTPLNAILGFSEMIHSEMLAPNTKKHVEYARNIFDSGHLLLALINDILDLAKIEAGGLMLRETEMNLSDLISDCARLMGSRAESVDLALNVETESALPHVRADERVLKQIVLNLLSNALKFTPPGGTVTLFAHLQPDGAMAFGVKDTGIGIADDEHERVFQNFGQGRHDVVTTDKGTGLGLPIVKGLTKAHGGEVILESEQGIGTCVTIVLPASRVCATPALQAFS